MTRVKNIYEKEYELVHSNGCCFFGHRNVKWSQDLEDFIYFSCKKLFLERNVKKFFFGDHSDFIKICYNAVIKLQNEFPIIKMIVVPVPCMAVLLKENPDDCVFAKRERWMIYDHCIRVPNLEKAGRASYVVRDRYMIDISQYCIVYYDENYKPKINNKRLGLSYQNKSGTKVALDYAVQKKKQIISILNSPKCVKLTQ